MSISGLLLGSLFQSSTHQTNQTQNQNNFQTIQTEFQQLGQDLQAGNLTQAEQDYVTLSQSLPGGAQQTGNSTLSQAFNALGAALQSGNLATAQQAFSTLQQDVQQQGPVAAHHHHHHGGDSGQNNSISQAFSSLGQALQQGNLTAAQQAFSTLQQDFQGFAFGGNGSSGSGALSTVASTTGTGALDVTA